MSAGITAASTLSTSASQPLARRISRVAAAARMQKAVSPLGVRTARLTARQISISGPEITGAVVIQGSPFGVVYGHGTLFLVFVIFQDSSCAPRCGRVDLISDAM